MPGGWTGHLFQRRFSSVVMDDSHFRAAVCYVGLNPVRAGLVTRPQDWPWSSVRAHWEGKDNALVRVRAALDRMPRFAQLLGNRCDEAFAVLRKSERRGRPAAAEDFVLGLERIPGRPVAPRAPGRKPAAKVTGKQLTLAQ